MPRYAESCFQTIASFLGCEVDEVWDVARKLNLVDKNDEPSQYAMDNGYAMVDHGKKKIRQAGQDYLAREIRARMANLRK